MNKSNYKPINIIVSFFFFLFLEIACFGQSGLELTYNNFTNKVTYKRNGKKIDQPYVKTGENIFITIEDFNYYIFDATITSENLVAGSEVFASETTPSSSNFFDLASLVTSGFSSLSNSLNIGSRLAETYGADYGSRSATPVNPANLSLEGKAIAGFQSLMNRLVKVEASLNASYKKLALINILPQNIEITKADMKGLLTSPNIRPEEIKEMIQQGIRDIFLIVDGEAVSTKNIIDLVKGDAFDSSNQVYQQHLNELDGIVADFQEYKMQLTLLKESDNFQLNKIRSSIDSISQVLITTYTGDNRKKMDSENLTQLENDIDFLIQLRTIYQELESTNFTYSFPPIQASGNEVALSVNLHLKNQNSGDTSDEYSGGPAKSIKTLKQVIPVKGGLKVTTGVGLSFASFASEKYQYSIRDNKIVGDQISNFLPMVTSFLHFYPQNSNAVKVGGSIGLGFPILGEESIRPPAFFLSPTLVFGSRQKILVSAGMMGASSKELSTGLELGENVIFSDSTLLPTRNVYGMGWFFGVSYKL